MSMNATAMATAIQVEMGFPSPPSEELIGWSSGLIAGLTAASFSNPPGTIVGICDPGGPLLLGAGTLGVITGMIPATIASDIAEGAGYLGVSSQLSSFCAQIVTHIQTLGLITFEPNSVIGVCTNTPISPGAMIGKASGGKISGLSGSVLAAAIHSTVGYPGVVSGSLTSFCTGMVNYIMDNADFAYPDGQVTGACPPGSGPLSGGTGVQGVIS